MSGPPYEVFADNVRRALARASRGELVTASATRELAREDLGALAAALEVQSTARTDASETVATITLAADQALLSLTAHRDGSVTTKGSSLRLPLRDPAALLAWLAARGAEGLSFDATPAPVATAPPLRDTPLPDGVTIVAVAKHGTFKNLASDGTHVAAFDGFSLRWFGPSVAPDAEERIARVTPLAVHEGHVYFERDGILRIDVKTGQIDAAPRAGVVRRVFQSAERESAAWRHEMEAVRAREAGSILLEPSPNDLEAWRAFGHLGVPRPAALALDHTWFYREGDGELHAHRRRERGQSIAFPVSAPVIALAAGEGGVIALAQPAADTIELSRVSESAGPTAAGRFRIPPQRVRILRSDGQTALVQLAGAGGDRLVRLPLRVPE